MPCNEDNRARVTRDLEPALLVVLIIAGYLVAALDRQRAAPAPDGRAPEGGQ
jgi:hypothetical protein